MMSTAKAELKASTGVGSSASLFGSCQLYPLRRITRIPHKCEATGTVEAICRGRVGPQDDPAEVAGGVAENVTQQTTAPSSATVQRQNVKTTEAPRGSVLPVNAAHTNQLARGHQSEKAFSGLLEAIRSARPLLTETRQKPKAFALTRLKERLHLNRVESCEAHDHSSAAEPKAVYPPCLF